MEFQKQPVKSNFGISKTADKIKFRDFKIDKQFNNSTKLKLSAIAAGSFLFLTNDSENIIFTGDLKNTEVLKNKPPRGKIYIV